MTSICVRTGKIVKEGTCVVLGSDGEVIYDGPIKECRGSYVKDNDILILNPKDFESLMQNGQGENHDQTS